MADVDASNGYRESTSLGASALFRQADITDYHAQSRFFKEVFEWGGGRLDFLAANAGVAEKMKLFEPDQEVDAEGLPKQLDTRILDVNLRAVIDGIWLFRYFHRKGHGRRKQGGKGKIVITASSAGL